MAVAVIMLAAPTAMAQKIKVESINSTLVKSDDAIANAKKAAKASTWLSRGEAYANSLIAPTKDLFTSMDALILKATCGDPISTGTEVVSNVTAETYVYPFFTAYLVNGRVAAWATTKEINEDATSIAMEAYAKAAEMDPKLAEKAKAGMVEIANYYATIGDNANILGLYEVGADAYTMVYELQSHPAYNEVQSTMMFYAGYLYTIAAAEDASLYSKGADALEIAIELGYADEEIAKIDVDDKDKGNIYYYLYHCYYGQKDVDEANIIKAKDALVAGVSIFPKNQRIIDALTQLYTIEKGVGDPSDLIQLIDDAISGDPENVDLWYARGRVFFSLQDFDNSIESFKEVARIAPEIYDGHFYLGVFYIYKGDAMNDEMGTKTYTTNAQYDEDLKTLYSIYAEAIPSLERAHEIKPEDITTVEYLKSLCFRLRDEEGVMDKYNAYNELLKEMQAQAAQ